MKMTQMRTLVGAMLPALVLAGCRTTVHEYPDTSVPTEVTVEFHTDRAPVEQYKEINYTRAGGRREAVAMSTRSYAEEDYYSAESHYMRFTMELHSDRASAVGADGASLFCRDVHHAETDSQAPHCDATYTVPPGQYTLIVWGDYVDKESRKDLCYNSADLMSVCYSPSVNDNRAKESYAGVHEFNIDQCYTKTRPARTVGVKLTRPFGRFRIMATDLEAFLSSGKNVEEVSIVLRYKQYVSAAYNTLTQSPSRFDETRSCTVTPRSVTEGGVATVLLAHDCVFVNGSESNVLVDIAVLDSGGREISRSNDILIPLARNKETVIRGEFLTTSFNPGGIGIRDEFDDEIVIPVD